MEILKNGSMEKAAEFDEKNDIKVRFECGRCGCEFVASSFAGECVRTSLSMPDVTEKWTVLRSAVFASISRLIRQGDPVVIITNLGSYVLVNIRVRNSKGGNRGLKDHQSD